MNDAADDGGGLMAGGVFYSNILKNVGMATVGSGGMVRSGSEGDPGGVCGALHGARMVAGCGFGLRMATGLAGGCEACGWPLLGKVRERQKMRIGRLAIRQQSRGGNC